MFETLPLFEEPASSFRQDLKQLLERFARHQIFIGTSSWKYEGWLGQIYSPERYWVRGRYSRKRFEQECLREYAETFPVVCGDFAFYQFPPSEFWTRLFDSVPPPLQFSFKIPEEITAPVFPHHPRYGARSGSVNPNFLDWALLQDAFLQPLERFRTRIPVLIFEFGSALGKTFAPSEFAGVLSELLRRLPSSFRYAVEIRNPELLAHAEYLALLKQYRMAHVFNAWSRMPDLREQIEALGVLTTDLTVVRALLKKGRTYEQAVQRFSPYREVQDPDVTTRQAIRDIVVRCIRRGEPAYIYVNNRLEGNAPVTIHEILTDLPVDLPIGERGENDSVVSSATQS